MSELVDVLRPDGLKLLLAVTLLVPAYVIIQVVSGYPSRDLWIPVILAILLSYWAACLIDYTVQSRTTKIFIATGAALVSIILGYILTRSTTLVCDPVHNPGGPVYDPVHTPGPTSMPTTPVVITTTEPVATPPLIYDPVHQPGTCSQACRDAISNTAGITDAVARKLDECLQNCGR